MVNAGDVRVRRAVEADVERLWEMCRDQTEAEFCLWGADLVYEYPPVKEQMRRRFNDLSGDTAVFAAEMGGRVIGFAEIGDMRERRNPGEAASREGPGEAAERGGLREAAHKSAGKSGVLSRVILEKDLRGRGYGCALVRGVLDCAAAQLGLEEAALIVYAHNRRAQSCYEACGFVRGEALLRPGRPDAYWMRAELPGRPVCK